MNQAILKLRSSRFLSVSGCLSDKRTESISRSRGINFCKDIHVQILKNRRGGKNLSYNLNVDYGSMVTAVQSDGDME